MTLRIRATYGSTVIHRHPRNWLLPLLTVCGVCVGTPFAAAAPGAPAHSYGWQDLLTNNVIACGVAAVALLVFSLLLRGLLKLTSLALVVVLVLGTFWFLREAIEHRAELLPHDWAALADENLHSAKAKEAWRSVEAEVSHRFPGNHATVGVEDSRRLLLAKLETKAAELRKRGHKSDAEQLIRLRDLVEAWKRE